MKRILLTGGGSGGHIFPLLAVAKELKKQPDVQLRYYGPKDIYAGYLSKEEIEVRNITPAKLRRYFDWKNFIDIPKFAWSFCQAVFKIYWFMPDVAFSKGGPAALPVIFACWFYQIPIVIHESDSVPGLTNSISAKFAKKVLLAFGGIGNPVREELLNYISYDPRLAKKQLRLDEERPLILVLGGSLGSVRINNFIKKMIEMILSRGQVIHQVGTANFESMKKLEQPGYQPYAFLEGERYGQMLAAADIIISRAGAGAIFEIAAFGKPSILIPLTESANDHQRQNAAKYSETGAAVTIEEANLLPHIFLQELDKILKSPQKQQSMQKAALTFAKPSSAKQIAEEILTI